LIKPSKKSSGGMVSALEGLGDKFNIHWIGWAGGVVEDLEKKEEITSQLKERVQLFPDIFKQAGCKRLLHRIFKLQPLAVVALYALPCSV
jgi:trehalose-6-phosphate synthase